MMDTENVRQEINKHMTTNISNLDKILGLAPVSSNNAVDVIAPQKLEILTDDDVISKKFEEDFNMARENIMNMLFTAREAVADMNVIAKDHEGAKDFEALNSLIKTVVESSNHLVDLYNRRSHFAKKNKSDDEGDTIHVENAIFTGSTRELMNVIKKIRKGSLE